MTESKKSALSTLRLCRSTLDEADELKHWHSNAMAKGQREGAQQAKQAIADTVLALEDSDSVRSEREDQEKIQWSSTEATSNTEHNRWANVWPWNHSMLPAPYLNASTIPCLPSSVLPVTSNQPYIATQAPLPDSLPAFYHHLLSSRATLLVNLTPEFDASRGFKMRKAHRYWPRTSRSGRGDPIFDAGDGWKVQVVSEEKNTQLLDHMKGRDFVHGKDWVIIQRMLKVTPPPGWQPSDPETIAEALSSGHGVETSSSHHTHKKMPDVETEADGSRTVEMIHVEHWVDGGDAASDNFARLVELIAQHQSRQRQVQQVNGNGTEMSAYSDVLFPPIWVHCSAGIGRTGTLIGGLLARDILLRSPSSAKTDDERLQLERFHEMSPVALTVRLWWHMRNRRAGLVTTAEQAMMILAEIERIKANQGRGAG